MLLTWGRGRDSRLGHPDSDDRDAPSEVAELRGERKLVAQLEAVLAAGAAQDDAAAAASGGGRMPLAAGYPLPHPSAAASLAAAYAEAALHSASTTSPITAGRAKLPPPLLLLPPPLLLPLPSAI